MYFLHCLLLFSIHPYPLFLPSSTNSHVFNLFVDLVLPPYSRSSSWFAFWRFLFVILFIISVFSLLLIYPYHLIIWDLLPLLLFLLLAFSLFHGQLAFCVLRHRFLLPDIFLSNMFNIASSLFVRHMVSAL